MQTTDVPAGLPPTSQARASSIKAGDIYGAYATAVPTTIQAGTAGGARVSAASDQLEAETPLTFRGFGPDFFRRPAGVLLLAVGALAVFSYLDK